MESDRSEPFKSEFGLQRVVHDSVSRMVNNYFSPRKRQAIDSGLVHSMIFPTWQGQQTVEFAQSDANFGDFQRSCNKKVALRIRSVGKFLDRDFGQNPHLWGFNTSDSSPSDFKIHGTENFDETRQNEVWGLPRGESPKKPSTLVIESIEGCQILLSTSYKGFYRSMFGWEVNFIGGLYQFKFGRTNKK